MDYNSITLTGYLASDIQFQVLNHDKKELPIAKFNIACNGAKEKDSFFMPVSIFGKKAELSNSILKKGKHALITGRLQSNKVDGKTYTEIICRDFVVLSKKEEAVPV
tara:strand:- start:182 stop:502 length:321 start_codon:yes stop_codon:yes gene_type:complete